MTYVQFCENFYNDGKQSYLVGIRAIGDIARFFFLHSIKEEYHVLIPDKETCSKWFAKKPSHPRAELWEHAKKDYADNKQILSNAIYPKLTKETERLLVVMDRFHFALSEEERKTIRSETIVRFSRALTEQFYAIAKGDGVANDIINKKRIPDCQETIPENLGEYYNFYWTSVCKRLSSVKTVLQDEGIPFEDIYVSQELTDSKHYNDEKSYYYISRPTISNPTILSLKKYAPHIIIQATGGMGKSMLMRFLLHDGVNHYRALNKITVFAWLMDYNHENYEIADFLYNEIQKYFPEYERTVFEKHLKEDRFIILLDGLDEIKSDYRRQFLSRLHIFSCTHHNTQIIMTSRPFGIETELGVFKTLKICPLSEKKAKELAAKLPTIDKEKKKHFVKELRRYLYRNYHIFARSPLLLTFMILTYDANGRIPRLKAEFYGEVYTVLATRHDKTKGNFERTLESGLTPEQFRRIFAALCANSYIEETRSFTYSSLYEYFKEIIKDLPKEEKELDPDALINDAITGVYMLYREGENYYFIHNSFQEYFTAVSLERQDPDELKELFQHLYIDRYLKNGDMSLQFTYEIIPDRVDKHLILPYLESTFRKCKSIQKEKGIDPYWAYLLHFGIRLEYAYGKAEDEKAIIIQRKELSLHTFIRNKEGIADACTVTSVPYYKDFVNGYIKLITNENGDEDILSFTKGDEGFDPPEDMDLSDPGDPNWSDIYDIEITVPVSVLIRHPEKYKKLIELIERDTFPLKEEYNKMTVLYIKLAHDTNDTTDKKKMRVKRI